MNAKKIVFSEGDKNVSTVGLLNLDELGPVQFNTTKLRVFHVLRKQKKGGDQFKFADGELDQYLDIEWINNKNDWYKKEFTNTAYHTKICEASDFGDDD